MPAVNHIETIILAGSNDFGRCPVASQLPTALWPVFGEPVLRRSVVHLANQGMKHITICSHEDDSLLKKAVDIEKITAAEIKFTNEPLPAGTAGSLRDAIKNKKAKLLVVLPVGIVRPPDMDFLIDVHHKQGADLTAVFNTSSQNDATKYEATGIYVCNPSVLRYIPAEGYCDIKEGLIPELLRADAHVSCAVLPESTGNFRDCKSYLYAVSNYLLKAAEKDICLKTCQRNGRNVIWKGADVSVEPGAKIYGRVALLDNARVEAGVVIFGPTVIGRGASVGRDSVVVNSVLWDGSHIGENCQIQRCLANYNAVVPSSSTAESSCILSEQRKNSKSAIIRINDLRKSDTGALGYRLQNALLKLVYKLPGLSQRKGRKLIPWLACGFISAAFLWSYWPGFVDLWNIWLKSDEYSSGLLVPFLAAFVLLSRRRQIAGLKIRLCLWGIPALIAAQAVRFFGLYYMYGSAERLSIVLSIVALVLFLFGWEFFRREYGIMFFLFLMLPWPNRVQTAVTLPLQKWATSSAVFCLEVLGYEAIQDGNIIHIGQVSVAVAEACNGLRMITAFFVISALVVLLVNRAWWEKLIILVSSLPIALLCNTIRLTLTAMAFTVLGGDYWERIFHDFGGYAMMPVALVIVVGELWFLSRMVFSSRPEKIYVFRKADRINADN